MNPYRLDTPALISVSGGRTSAFMLRNILDAFGGSLPSDVVPIFCNTGREHEATLIFLRELEERWSCAITWLEYTHETGKHGFKVVTFCTASRNGEPFAAVNMARKGLPTPINRHCTSELKIRTGNRFAKSLGWSDWQRAVGLRYDEPRRVAKMSGDIAAEEVVLPMNTARHTISDVTAFWNAQPFDLKLPGGDNSFGNCDLCFLKGREKIEKVMRTNPKAADWWIEQEETEWGESRRIRTFRIDRPSYRQMLTQLTVQGRLLDDAIEDDTMPCMCHD